MVRPETVPSETLCGGVQLSEDFEFVRYLQKTGGIGGTGVSVAEMKELNPIAYQQFLRKCCKEPARE